MTLSVAWNFEEDGRATFFGAYIGCFELSPWLYTGTVLRKLPIPVPTDTDAAAPNQAI